ncbi:MAG: helix-turn-helix domain-containing protein [Pirellulaceae bacterium]
MEAAIMCAGDTIDTADLKSAIADMPERTSSGLYDQELVRILSAKLLEDVNRRYLERAMEEAEGVKTKAADLLGYPAIKRLTPN